MSKSTMKKVDGYRQEQAWRDLARQQTTITAEQLAGYYAVCDEFGDRFAGIRDRADNVSRDMSNAVTREQCDVYTVANDSGLCDDCLAAALKHAGVTQ